MVELPDPFQFSSACSILPLISIDWIVTSPDGKLLLGFRRNAPARGWWFTPGGRIRKNESFSAAMIRVADEELGLPSTLLDHASMRMMGVWDHFYEDSAFATEISTHYINLPHWLPLSWQDIDILSMRPNSQHAAWQWLDVAVAESSEIVHPYVRSYARWLMGQQKLNLHGCVCHRDKEKAKQSINACLNCPEVKN